MGTFNIFNKNFDKKYIILSLLTILLAIICGIVLCKYVIYSTYFRNFAVQYVSRVYKFNFILVLTYFLSCLIYGYVILILTYYLKLKYVTLIFLFIKSLFFCVYVIALFCVNVLSGAVVAIFVYIPSYLISISTFILISETCSIINKRFVIFFPLILCAICSVIFFVLLNFVFRFIVAIV